MGQEDDEGKKTMSLPDDLLVDILGCLAPRWLAVSRCVCKAWQATVDARRLLDAHYARLPFRLEGIFLYFTYHKFPEFFSRPWKLVTGEMDFLPSANEYMEDDLCEIQDHCNGLLLLQDAQTGIPNYVANPATRRWDPLPDCPPIHVMGVDCWSDAYLVYDPMVSLHYEVFVIPSLPYYKRDGHLDPLIEESEWPPATCTIHVFSSRTRRWEPRSFDRDGDALGTVVEMRTRGKSTCSMWWVRRRAVYWRATLYVHCSGNFLTSISLSNGVFRAIELPEGAISDEYTTTYLGRSEKGVYFASIYKGRLRIWILNEPCGKMEWMLKHEHGLVLPRHEFGRPVVHGPWVLQDMNYNFFWDRMSQVYGNEEAISDEEEFFKWSSDDDCDVVAGRDMAKEYFGIVILGFHPFKEIIFLLLDGYVKTPLAYHYNSLKAEVLGNVEPTGYYGYFHLPNDARTIEGFPYVPCWLEEFPTNTTQSGSS